MVCLEGVDWHNFASRTVAKKADAWLKSELSLLISIVYAGRGGGIRTPDPLLPNQVLWIRPPFAILPV